jgi:hypothetical protein
MKLIIKPLDISAALIATQLRRLRRLRRGSRSLEKCI